MAEQLAFEERLGRAAQLTAIKGPLWCGLFHGSRAQPAPCPYRFRRGRAPWSPTGRPGRSGGIPRASTRCAHHLAGFSFFLKGLPQFEVFPPSAVITSCCLRRATTTCAMKAGHCLQKLKLAIEGKGVLDRYLVNRERAHNGIAALMGTQRNARSVSLRFSWPLFYRERSARFRSLGWRWAAGGDTLPVMPSPACICRAACRFRKCPGHVDVELRIEGLKSRSCPVSCRHAFPEIKHAFHGFFDATDRKTIEEVARR